MSRKQKGRSSQKRLHRKLTRKLSELSPEEIAEISGKLLTPAQLVLLETYQLEVQKSTEFLGGMGAWSFLESKIEEAERNGLGDTLRHLVFQSAAQFADPRMARVTRKYSQLK